MDRLFASDLLAGRRIALAGVPDQPLGEALRELGAELVDPAAGAEVFVVGAGAPRPELSRQLDELWAVIGAAANDHLIPAGGGRLILLAPRPSSGPHGDAVPAAMVNLARTLSVEWARYSLTVTALTPGADAGDEEIAALVAYLASAAGGYFSGCRLELRAIPSGHRGPEPAPAR